MKDKQGSKLTSFMQLCLEALVIVIRYGTEITYAQRKHKDKKLIIAHDMIETWKKKTTTKESTKTL